MTQDTSNVINFPTSNPNADQAPDLFDENQFNEEIAQKAVEMADKIIKLVISTESVEPYSSMIGLSLGLCLLAGILKIDLVTLQQQLASSWKFADEYFQQSISNLPNVEND